MAAGASTSVHVIAVTDKEDCGTVTNTASVTTSNDGSDSDTATVEVLCAAIDVDKVADAESVTAGGTTHAEPEDYGFMYQHGYQDLDGHIWELVYMDPTAIQQG